MQRFDFGTEYRGNTSLLGIVGKVGGRYVHYEDYVVLLTKVEAIGAGDVSELRA